MSSDLSLCEAEHPSGDFMANKGRKMNPVLVEIFMFAIIMAYVFMGGIFVFSQKQGKNFIASFDMAVVWGMGAFVTGCCLDTVAYVALV